MDCHNLKEELKEEIERYNENQSPELRVVNRGVREEHREEYKCYEQKELKDVFYSDKVDSCLHIEISRTICKSLMSYGSGEYYISHETYYLYDTLKDKKIDYNDGVNFMKTIHRGEYRNSEYEVMELIDQYK